MLQEAGIPLMIHAGYPSDANGREDTTMGENIAVCAFLILQPFNIFETVESFSPSVAQLPRRPRVPHLTHLQRLPHR